MIYMHKINEHFAWDSDMIYMHKINENFVYNTGVMVSIHEGDEQRSMYINAYECTVSMMRGGILRFVIQCFISTNVNCILKR